MLAPCSEKVSKWESICSRAGESKTKSKSESYKNSRENSSEEYQENAKLNVRTLKRIEGESRRRIFFREMQCGQFLRENKGDGRTNKERRTGGS